MYTHYKHLLVAFAIDGSYILGAYKFLLKRLSILKELRVHKNLTIIKKNAIDYRKALSVNFPANILNLILHTYEKGM